MKSLLAALVLVLIAASCADDDDKTTDGDEPAGNATETVEPTGTSFDPPGEPGETPEEGRQTIGDDGRGLYVYSPDDESLEQIADAAALGERGVGLDWFPDGESIAAFGANLLRVELDGGSEIIHEPLDLAFGTEVSPDGSRVAFSCSGPSSADVCIVEATAGGTLTRASEDEYFDYLLNWLDDDRILILSDARPGAPDIPVYDGHFPELGGYFVLNTVDGNIVPATQADVGDPWLSPEGEWSFALGPAPDYAFFTAAADARIVVPLEAEDVERIDPTALADQFDVAWSNGDIYAALVQRVVVEEAGFIRSAYNVWLIDLSAESVELIVQTEPCMTDLDCVVTVDWAPDASSLAILFGIAGD